MTEPTISDPQKEKLLGFIRTGEREPCDLGGHNPSIPDHYGPEQTITATLLYQICTGNYPDLKVHSKGVRLKGAKIVGVLDFQSASILYPLELIDCRIEEAIYLTSAKIKNLVLKGSFTQGINAKDMESAGNVSLCNEFISTKQISFERAKIRGDLNCSYASFSCDDEPKAFNADGITVDGRILFQNSKVRDGEVSIKRANIGSNFNCRGANFDYYTGTALNLSGSEIGGSVLLTDEEIDSSCQKQFTSSGEINLVDTAIKGNLNCRNAKLKSANDFALNADHLSVNGGVYLNNGFTADGGVSLCLANIDGHLKFQKAKIYKMQCQCGTADDDEAINAYGIKIKGHLEFKGTSVTGKVNFFGAAIGGNFTCTGARINNPGDVAFCISDAEVKGTFYWNRMDPPPIGEIVFARAKVGEYEDDKLSWPEADLLNLDGFVYGSLNGESPTDFKNRLTWLNHNGKTPFRPQPYVQLIKVLRELGHKKDAREIAIKKQIKLNNEAHLPSRIWSRFLQVTLGYGYKPWRALILVLLTIILGTAIFYTAEKKADMVPTDIEVAEKYLTNGDLPSSYPDFIPPVYSLDAFLPVVQLGQVKHWRPISKSISNYQIYLWCHIILGWLLTTLAVAGLSGIVKKDK